MNAAILGHGLLPLRMPARLLTALAAALVLRLECWFVIPGTVIILAVLALQYHGLRSPGRRSATL